jgi:hypothetical protein
LRDEATETHLTALLVGLREALFGRMRNASRTGGLH